MKRLVLVAMVGLFIQNANAGGLKCDRDFVTGTWGVGWGTTTAGGSYTSPVTAIFGWMSNNQWKRLKYKADGQVDQCNKLIGPYNSKGWPADKDQYDDALADAAEEVADQLK